MELFPHEIEAARRTHQNDQDMADLAVKYHRMADDRTFSRKTRASFEARARTAEKAGGA